MTGELPHSLRDIAEVLGLRIALGLVQHFGGLEIKPPMRPAANHPIIVALGKEDGEALCSFLSGGAISVPHMRRRKSIRADVLNLQAEGRDRREIARLLGVSQRHVRRMANKPPDKQQLSLFPE